MLNVWRIEQSALCRLHEETELIEHLFWYCPSMAHFWSQIQEWLLCHNIRVKMGMQTVFLGDLKNHDQSMGNIIMLLGKVFILGQY
jgi:hypothetical protein